jgi:hypothetical protein
MGYIRGGAPTTTGPARHDIYIFGNIGNSEYFQNQKIYILVNIQKIYW